MNGWLTVEPTRFHGFGRTTTGTLIVSPGPTPMLGAMPMRSTSWGSVADTAADHSADPWFRISIRCLPRRYPDDALGTRRGSTASNGRTSTWTVALAVPPGIPVLRIVRPYCLRPARTSALRGGSTITRKTSRVPGKRFFVGGSIRIQPTLRSSTSTVNSSTVSLLFVTPMVSSDGAPGAARIDEGSTVIVGSRRTDWRAFGPIASGVRAAGSPDGGGGPSPGRRAGGSGGPPRPDAPSSSTICPPASASRALYAGPTARGGPPPLQPTWHRPGRPGEDRAAASRATVAA